MERIRVLLIEDSPGDARLIKEMLAEETTVFFDLEWVDDLAKGLKRLTATRFQVVLLDLNLPDSRGFNTFARLRTEAPGTPVLIMTGLNDETLAIRTVRMGAQDYLIKGTIEGRQLGRSIRYAIARRLGEERSYTLQELQQYDGKEGRPARFAFKGKVYDVTASRLWKDGLHGSSKHIAGTDLTDALKAAPHGEEAMAKVHIVGELRKEPTLAQKLVLRIEGLHLHPVSVHFSIAYSSIILLFSLLFLFTDNTAFEKASYYMLVAGVAVSVPAAASGFFSWKVTYQGKMTRIFFWKIVITFAFIAAIAACFVWRFLVPDVLVARTMTGYVYLALTATLVPMAGILGNLGGRIVYP